MTSVWVVMTVCVCIVIAIVAFMRLRRIPEPAAAERPRTGIVKIKLDSFPPLALAKLEIAQLASDQELVPLCALGGPPPPGMEEENERRHAEYQRRKFAIIKKYGVEDAFLEPLLIQRRRLERDLGEVGAQIAELKTLKEA